MATHIIPPIDRFKKYYIINPITQCWEWNRPVNKHRRYASLNIGGRNVASHRFSYEYYIGQVPKGKEVCHKCDNTICVSPFHLFTGTHKENMQDAQDKGRLPKSIHPSIAYYKHHGCRCEDCSKLWSEYCKKKYDERQIKKGLPPADRGKKKMTPEERIAKNREYDEKRSKTDKRKEWGKQNYLLNKDKILAKNKKWRDNNPDKLKKAS